MPPEEPNNSEAWLYQQTVANKDCRCAKWGPSGPSAHVLALNMITAMTPCTLNSRSGPYATPSPAFRSALLASIASCAATVSAAPFSAPVLYGLHRRSLPPVRGPVTKASYRRRHVFLKTNSSCSSFKSKPLWLIDRAPTPTSSRTLHLGH